MCIELYPHNQKTYETIIKMWETENKVAACQPTGTGKSFLILKCCEFFEGQNKIVLAPSNYILDQLTKQNTKVLASTTLMTYAALQNLTEKELKYFDVSLIVLDEFHRCGAEEWGKGVQRLLETYPNAKVLGTSATPIRYLDNARDMSDELFNGNIACNMSLPEAIVEGILPMPKYVSALYTFDEEADNMIEKVNKSKNSDEEKKMIIKDIEKLKNKLDKSKGIPKILRKYISNYSGKYIVFCKNKEHMDEMKDAVIKWFKIAKSNVVISLYEVYSQSSESDKQLELFINDNSENTLKILFSIDMLNEGLHINNLDGVILLRPTVSPIIYYQQIGRTIDAGRKENPLVLDFVNNFDNIKVNRFKDDLILTAREYFKSNRDKFKNEDNFVSRFIVYDETYDVLNLFNEISEKLIDSWELNIQALKQFKNREGHCNVPIKYIEILDGKEVKLGEFRSHLLRNSYILTDQKVNQLNEIGFVYEKYTKDFNFCYDMCVKIKSETGNANVKQNYVYNDYNIGSWQVKMRQLYKNNKLSNSKIERLEQIGFIFDVFEHNWNTLYLELEKYYKANGDSNVPKAYKINGVNLGSWVGTQRKSYKNKKLSNERINKLLDLKFEFIGK